MEQIPKSVYKIFVFFIAKTHLSWLIFLLTPIVVVIESNLIPYVIKMIVDFSVEYNEERSEFFYKIIPTIFLGIGAWISFLLIIRLEKWLESKVIPSFEANIRMATIRNILNHPYQSFVDDSSGSILHKVSDLPRALESIRTIISWNCIPSFVLVISTMIMLSNINIIFVYILAIWFVIQIFIIFYLGRYVHLSSEINAAHKNHLFGIISDVISNIFFVKLSYTKNYEINYIQKIQNNELKSHKHLFCTINLFQFCMDFPITIMLGSMLYFALYYWFNYSITTGDFIFIFNSTYAVIYQVWYLGIQLTYLFREVGIVSQTIPLIVQQNTELIHEKLKPLYSLKKGQIEFNQVSFAYHNKGNIFNKLDLLIEGGTKVGIVGLSGSGKSTLVNLLLNLYPIESGNIYIDKHDIRKYDMYNQVSIVPQNTSLFHRTILDNIKYGNEAASDDDVFDASIKAGCHDFIKNLPNGYNTIIGENGADLSGGQKQRIAIARVILKNSLIIIFDEATSALDSLSEKNIFLEFANTFKDKTFIIITHRLSTITQLDKIIVMKGGKIIGEGSHNQLLENNHEYSQMCKQNLSLLP
jgi:ATP-binding cassette subfamily B protein